MSASVLLPLRLLVCAALAFPAAPGASAETVVDVVDANTLKLGETTYRLWGMDAPDPEQTCARAWPAGREASAALAKLVADKTVQCEEKGRDREGRTTAVCAADGADLGAAMVRDGMAWADLATTRAYVVQEARSTAEYRGVHGHHCKTAWDWRARKPPEPQFRRQ
jgi:endonuclease YncB( thermonuclease family)